MNAAEITRLVHDHIPNLLPDDESRIKARAADLDCGYEPGEGYEVADLALRTCSCGKPIDGFYEYVDHLTAALVVYAIGA